MLTEYFLYNSPQNPFNLGEEKKHLLKIPNSNILNI